MSTMVVDTELATLLDSMDSQARVKVGGAEVPGAYGIHGAFLVAEDILHGNPEGAKRGRLFLEVEVEMAETDSGRERLRIVSRNLMKFCPDMKSLDEPLTRKLVLIKNDQPIVDRRQSGIEPEENDDDLPEAHYIGLVKD